MDDNLLFIFAQLVQKHYPFFSIHSKNPNQYVSFLTHANLHDGIWLLCVCVCVFTPVCVSWCVCVNHTGGGASLPCLAPTLAARCSLPCIRKHAGVGLESRSGLENDVETLPRPPTFC